MIKKYNGYVIELHRHFKNRRDASFVEVIIRREYDPTKNQLMYHYTSPWLIPNLLRFWKLRIDRNTNFSWRGTTEKQYERHYTAKAVSA